MALVVTTLGVIGSSFDERLSDMEKINGKWRPDTDYDQMKGTRIGRAVLVQHNHTARATVLVLLCVFISWRTVFVLHCVFAWIIPWRNGRCNNGVHIADGCLLRHYSFNLFKPQSNLKMKVP